MASVRERAYALAAARALGPRAEARCQKVSARAARVAAELDRRGPAYVAELQRELDSPDEPPDGVHPTWYETPPESARPEVQRFLNRQAYGHLLPMTLDPAPAKQQPVSEIGAERLAKVLQALGRRRIAIAFQAAPRAQLAQLCARLGEPMAEQLITEVEGLGTLSVEEVRAAQRALLRLPSARLRAGEELFLEAGCSWLGPALAHDSPDALGRLAHRLPRELGRRLLEAANAPTTEAERQAALRLLGTLG